MRTAEVVSIGSIFSRREDDQYTNSARTYQRILKYCLVLKQNRQSENSDNQSFTWWEVTDWLTKFGYLVAWIIESFDENKDQDLIQNELYTLVTDIFTIGEHSPSSNIFFSVFVKKCNDRKEFRNVIALFRQGISEGNLLKITDLFNYIWRLDFEDLQTRIRFNSIFLESLPELDPETQKLILYALKLDIERRMKAVADNFEKFEQARFMIRADYNKVALECICMNCDMSIYIGMDLLDYRKSVVDSYSEWTGFLSRVCPQCNTDSLIIRIV